MQRGQAPARLVPTGTLENDIVVFGLHCRDGAGNDEHYGSLVLFSGALNSSITYHCTTATLSNLLLLVTDTMEVLKLHQGPSVPGTCKLNS